MKTYEAIFDEEHNTGVYGISLVQNPAMQGMFIALNKDEKQLKFKEVSKEEKKVVGLVLEPNKPIYRNNNGEEYNIVFSDSTIKNLSYNFFKQNFQKNSTIEHEEGNRIEGVTFVESWIVEDVKLDKQNLYGFNYPKGSWLAVLKIDNDEVWNDYVKTGAVKGFSIDGLLSLKEVNLKSNINMSKEVLEETQKQTSILGEVLNAVKLAFTPKQEEVKLGSVKTEDGQITIEYEGEELVSGGSVWFMADAETKVPAPVGEHKLEGGKVLVITEEGIIGEVKEATPEETPEAPQAEEMATDNASDSAQANEIANAIKSILVKYQEVEQTVKEVKTELSTFKSVNEKLAKENEELKVALNEQPATKPKKSQPTQVKVDFSKLTPQQRINKYLSK